ncbi:MAG: hypothetical protein KAT43_06590 [Nanoarchaeota archaeon]|nr:hypothetical protein [Nanoarchaeota archaeon]
MKKILVLLILVLIFVVSATAVDFGFFNAKPHIIDVQVTPLKVRPGIPLEINVKVKSNNEVDSAYATFNFEDGSDTMRMIRTYSNNNIEEFSSVWLTHDTLDKKWYTTDIVITDKNGRVAEKTVEWQDPVVSHNWSELDGTGFCIVSFSQTSCPDGYTSLGTNHRLLRADSSDIGGTGGVRTHSHIVNGTTSLSIPYVSDDQGTGAHNAMDTEHYHTITNVPTNTTTSMPDYYHLNICCRD